MNINRAGVEAFFSSAVATIKNGAKDTWKDHPTLLKLATSIVGYFVVIKTVRSCFLLGKHIVLQSNFRQLERDMVHLFVHHRWSHGPNYFPHCLKVETFLRLAKIPYTIHFTSNASLSPTGRIPFVVHNGAVLGDSGHILHYLEKAFGVQMDAALAPPSRHVGLLVRRMVETSLNYGLQRTTMVDRPELLQDMFAKEYLLEPSIARLLVRRMRARLIEVLRTVGYGNLAQSYYTHEFLRQVESLETLLSGQKFLLGDAPTTYDCSVYGWLQIASEIGPHGPALVYLNESKVIREYVARMSTAAFPDIDELVTVNESQKYVPVT